MLKFLRQLKESFLLGFDFVRRKQYALPGAFAHVIYCVGYYLVSYETVKDLLKIASKVELTFEIYNLVHIPKIRQLVTLVSLRKREGRQNLFHIFML